MQASVSVTARWLEPNRSVDSAQRMRKCKPAAPTVEHAAAKRSLLVAAASAPQGPGLAPDVPSSVAWDPDGLLPPQSSEGHFARRERQRAQAAGLQLQQQGGVRPIPAEHLAAGGIPAADGSLYDRAALEKQLADRFLPVDLDTPGLRILHLDPPIFALPAFFSEEQCDEFVAAAVDSAALVPSKVGGGNLRDLGSLAANNRRTSTSVLVDGGVQAAHPRLAAMATALQGKGLRLLGQGEGGRWGAPGKLPGAGQYCYEALQMARYEAGQHFLSHEDGFPAPLARQNGFQRHATLLVYLNTPAEGGATRFDLLNLASRPEKGKALLFFPAFADGTADPRTLHTAEDAVDTKWVTQQWVARGLSTAVPDPIAAALAGSLPAGGSKTPTAGLRQQPGRPSQPAGEAAPLAADALLLAGKRGKGKGKGKLKGGKPGGGKGFGA